MRTGGAVDAEAIARSLRDWFVARRLTGLGSATLKALRDLARVTCSIASRECATWRPQSNASRA